MKTVSNKVKIALLVILTSLGIISCAEGGGHFESEAIMIKETGVTSDYESVEVEPPLASVRSRVDLKIIRNASIKIKVDDIHKVSAFAKTFTENHLGYVSDERMSKSNYTKETRFTLRVPQEHFDKVLEHTERLGEFVDYKNITTLDVTEKYIDLSSRLKTKKEVQARYVKILRDKAQTVEEIFQAEEKLRVLQEEIEAAEGSLRYMSNQVTFSTIQVEMYQVVIPEDVPSDYEPSFLDNAGEGFSFGWELVVNIVVGIIYIWPLFVIVAILFFGIKLWRKSRIVKK